MAMSAERKKYNELHAQWKKLMDRESELARKLGDRTYGDETFRALNQLRVMTEVKMSHAEEAADEADLESGNLCPVCRKALEKARRGY